MSGIFTKGAYVSSSPDDSRKTLVAIQDSEGSVIFDNCFITNFESTRSADASILKNMDSGFMFTTFGPSPISIVVHGIFTGDTYTDDKGDNKNQYMLDPEELFDKYNISGPERMLMTLTTVFGSSDGTPTQYKGYMISFRKNPMSDDKFQAYGFSVTFVAQVVRKKKA